MANNLNLPKADLSDIEALFPNGKPKWASNTITYNFLPSLPISYIGAPILETLRQDASGVPGKDFKPFNQAQKLAAEAALQLWADVANITFQRKEDKALQLADFITPDPIKFILKAVGAYDDFADAIDDIAGKYLGFPIVEGADIRFGTDNQGTVSSGYAYYPASNLLENIEEAKNNFFDAVDSLIKPINDAIDALNDLIIIPIDLIPNLPTASKIFPFATLKLGRYGDIFINNASANNQPDKIGITGSKGFQTLIHEIGHTLGLEHPGNYNAGGGGTDAPYLTGEKDSYRYTVMSYNSPFGSVSPETPMLYDIAAVQQLYGANFSTRSGDTVYSWGKPFVATIWDGGGNDTIDASNWSTNVTIDLNEGEFSSIGLDANLAIAFGVTIENAIGGTGDDMLIGNQVSNRLEGGAGNDILIGGAGADILIGGADIDTASYKTSPQGVTINLVTGLGFGGEATGDTLQSIENLEGSEFDDTFIANADPNRLDGRSGTDTVSYVNSTAGVKVNLSTGVSSGGFASGDFLINIENIQGSDFDDTLTGDSKINVLNGRGGNDLLDGGAGKDTLIGGADFDTVSYASSSTGVVIDLSTGSVTGGDAEGDIPIEIEGFGGSEFSDTFIGDDNANTFSGLGGDDAIGGRGGNDLLNGGAGNDSIDGGADVDTVIYDTSLGGVVVNINESQGYSNIADPSDLEPTFTIASGSGLDGFGGTDTLRNLENIIGSGYNDVLIGNALKNTLNGLDGDDLLIGNGGDDILDGGADIDTVSYRRSVSGVSVDLSTGIAADGIDGLDTLINIENLIGSQFADRLTGNSQANTILGGDGNDIISGKEGNDRLFGEKGKDKIYGGIGDDYLVGGADADLLDGGDGNDTASYITSTAGVLVNLGNNSGAFADAQGDRFISIENIAGSNYDDFLYGDDNNNILIGLDGNDVLRGEGGDDRLDGGTGDNILNGGSGNNTIVAADGKNTVYAESGNDSVLLGNGNNTVFAGDGNNSISIGNGDNTVYTKSGNDSIVLGNGNNTVFAGDGKNTITSGSGNDTLYGGAVADIIYAGAGNNTVFAYEGQNIVVTQDGKDTIYAGSGRDFISTGGGDDIIFAGNGDNWIDAGTGKNTIYSGNGRNLFILSAGDGFDTIKNFEIGKDKLGLTNGLQLDRLVISQVNSNGFLGTEIGIAGSSEVLARLEWTQASQLTSNSFMTDLPSSNSALLALFG